MKDKRDEAQLLYSCAMYAMLSIYAAHETDAELAEAIEGKVFYLPISVFARLFFDAATAEASAEALEIEDVRRWFPGDTWRGVARRLREAFEAQIIAAVQDTQTPQLHLILHELVKGHDPRRMAGLVRYVGGPGCFAGVAPGDIGSVMNITDDDHYEVSFSYDEAPYRSAEAMILVDMLEHVGPAYLLPPP